MCVCVSLMCFDEFWVLVWFHRLSVAGMVNQISTELAEINPLEHRASIARDIISRTEIGLRALEGRVPTSHGWDMAFVEAG